MSDTITSIPTNANEGCVGTKSKDAGRSKACSGCPNQSLCASGEISRIEQDAIQKKDFQSIRSALRFVNNVLLIMSGKGGVGKSTVCCQIAHTLAKRDYSVGILDVDICGPSVAQIMGVKGRTVHTSGSGWTPVYVTPNLSVMSVSFLLQNEDSAVIWRGPRKNGLIKQFLTETHWDEEGLDYLLIDTPPGTSDEHISTVQYLQGSLYDKEESKSVLGGAIVVTTPEELSMADVRKELNFCQKTKLPVVGVVENMKQFYTTVKNLCFHRLKTKYNSLNEVEDCTKEVLATLEMLCPEILDIATSVNVFPSSGNGAIGMAKIFNVPYLGGIPLDPNLMKSCQEGFSFVSKFPQSVAVQPLNDIIDQLVNILPVEFIEK